MTHAMATFIAPLGLEKLDAAQQAIDALGNPANDAIRAKLASTDGEGTHFASMHAIRSPDGQRGYIVFEFSADGGDDEATKRIVAAIGSELRAVFMLSSDWSDGGDFAAFLKSHKVEVGSGLFDHPGVPFAGTPGFTVGRIRFEDDVARFCASHVEAQDRDLPALARVAAVRAAIGKEAKLKSALEPATPVPPFKEGDLLGLITAGIGAFVTTYLWPLIVLGGLAGLIGGLAKAWNAHGFWHWIGVFVAGAVPVLWASLWIALVVVIVAAVALYLSLRAAEDTDSVEVHSAPQHVNSEMFERENRVAQNHMISVTERKPGIVRWFTLRLAFLVVALAATRYFRPGFLSDIGTIHFARWVTVPGSRDLLFMSNYGGSWESYLEDFITKAHAGLTAVWSNTVGFPKTENLFDLGATDGDHFKRFARHSMVPTRFWYSAYPNLITDVIRSNALVRAGLSGVMTEDEAINWLQLFGSASRPKSKLVSNDIQSIMFGGLGFLPFGSCLLCELPDDKDKARAWLTAVYDRIAFNDGRRLAHDAVITLSVSWHGLLRLGLPKYAGITFPFAFVEGMTEEHRSRILGDTGVDNPDAWWWGKPAPDAAILIYGRSDTSVDELKRWFLAECAAAGMPSPREIPLKTITEDKREAFGFVDGISQPVIRGTYKSLRNADPIHIVEPGEMILGYPDNRGYIPPSPTLEPNSDPANRLPLLGAPNDFSRTVADATRDVGFNGSFLVIRQLEQHVGEFNAYCKAEAKRLTHRLGAPFDVTDKFIGAKLVGRWQDGSSLLREPYKSASDHREKLVKRAQHQATVNQDLVIESIDVDATSRPRSNPLSGTPIDPAGKHADKLDLKAAAGLVPPPSARGHERPIRPDNDFLFGAEDPEGLRCPYGAHIRRANPRDSLDPGNADQVAISNRHRITRIGRQYVPEPGRDPGLFFMCFCADIERQFEFLQQTWLKSPSFHGLASEKDPILGDAQHGACSFTVPSPDGPVGLKPMPRFVTTRGGGYFFIPGRRLIEYLLDPLTAAYASGLPGESTTSSKPRPR